MDDREVAATGTDESDGREQEQLWPARQHPDELVLPDVHPTRFPGTWVCIYEDHIPNDQRHILQMEGYHLYRIRLLEGRKAQVIIREDDRPDRDDELEHSPTGQRYEQYDPRAPRTYRDTEGDR